MLLWLKYLRYKCKTGKHMSGYRILTHLLSDGVTPCVTPHMTKLSESIYSPRMLCTYCVYEACVYKAEARMQIHQGQGCSRTQQHGKHSNNSGRYLSSVPSFVYSLLTITTPQYFLLLNQESYRLTIPPTPPPISHNIFGNFLSVLP